MADSIRARREGRPLVEYLNAPVLPRPERLPDKKAKGMAKGVKKTHKAKAVKAKRHQRKDTRLRNGQVPRDPLRLTGLAQIKTTHRTIKDLRDIPDLLYVDQSGISGAGNGLFAGQDLEPGLKLGVYLGRPLKPYLDEMDNGRVLTVPKRPSWMTLAAYKIYSHRNGSVVLRDEPGTQFSNYVAFANDPLDDRKVNCEFDSDGTLYATGVEFLSGGRMIARTIKEGEEIFVSYGQKYWLPKFIPTKIPAKSAAKA